MVKITKTFQKCQDKTFFWLVLSFMINILKKRRVIKMRKIILAFAIVFVLSPTAAA